jgi:DNA polymerase sigma
MENQSDFIGFESSSESEISDGEITIIKPTPKAQDTSIKSVDPLTRLPTNPWVKPNRKYSSNLITYLIFNNSKLDQEIRDFDKFIHPTVAEHQMRLFTINRLRKLVHTIFDIDSDLKCFGSFETKLYLPSSDLDMVIINPRLHKPNCLYALEEGLKKYNISSQIDVIARSKV